MEVALICSFFFIGLASILVAANRNSNSKWADLADIGTFLQGLAAAFVILIGLIKGDEILNHIRDLKTSLDGVRKIVEETNLAIKTYQLPPLPPKRESQDDEIGRKLETDLLKDYWRKQLAEFPEKEESGKLIYIPNKQEVIEELSKPRTNLEDQLTKAVILKKSLRTNSNEVLPNTQVSADVLSSSNGGFKIQVNKVNKSSPLLDAVGPR